MRIGDLLPLRRYDVELPISCGDLLARVRGLVTADSLVVVDYWAHKGHYVGKVTERGFLLKRFIRRVWVPLILGRVSQGPRCRLKMWFFAPEATVFVLVSLVLSVIAVRGFGPGALGFPVLFVAGHVVGCLHFREETALFLRAAGIEVGTDASSGESGAEGGGTAQVEK